MPYMPEGFPLPQTDAPPTQGFWEHAKRHELVVQKCSDCGKLRHPPSVLCPYCQSFNYGWHKVSGKGVVYSYYIAHYPPSPVLKERVPYNVLLVEIPDGDNVRMHGNLIDGTPNEEIKVGMPVEVTWEDINKDVTLPQWKRATSK